MPAMQQMLVGVGGAYTFANTEAATVCAAFTTPANTARKQAIDTLVGSLKLGAISATNLWAKLDALQIYAAADSQAALLNWKSPGTLDASLVGTPTFTADRGFTSIVSGNHVINTNCAPASMTQLTQNSMAVSGWFITTAAAANSGLGGLNVSNQGISLNPRSTTTDNVTARANDGSAGTIGTTTDGSGLSTVMRTGSTVKNVYRNGVVYATTSNTASVALVSNTLYMGGSNNNGTASISARQFSAFLCGSGRTANEELDVYNAVRVYMQAVGAA